MRSYVRIAEHSLLVTGGSVVNDEDKSSNDVEDDVLCLRKFNNLRIKYTKLKLN